VRALFLLALVAGAALAQPSKPLRIIVPFPPGGTADALARLTAERLPALLGHQVLVENRAGAGGNLGAEQVWRAEPDGLTVLASPPHLLTINPLLYKLNFDPGKFVPVGLIATYPNVLVASAKVPAASLDELIKLARANPGKLSIASQGNGTISHLSAELLKKMAQIDLLHVPYKGTAPALTDLLGGQTDYMFATPQGALAMVKGGKLRALAVTSATRFPTLPDVPTLSEALAMPDLEAVSWHVIFARHDTPREIVNRLHGEMGRIMAAPEMQQKIMNIGLIPYASPSVEGIQAYIKAETEKWGALVRQLGLEGSQ